MRRPLLAILLPAALFAAGVLWRYEGRITAGGATLIVGFLALATSAWWLVRAAALLARPEDASVLAVAGEDLGRTELLREKRSLLRAIKEVEFDRGLHKIGDEDAAAATARYRARAIEILRILDARKAVDYAAVVESELARRRAGEVGAARRCACGTKNDPDSVFCKRCGARLEGTP